MADCSRCRHWCFMISAFVGLFIGISGCFVFSFTFSNYQAGFLAGFSGLLAALCLHLQLLEHFSQMAAWYTPGILRRVAIFAGVMLVAVLSFLAWCLTNIITRHEGFYPIETSDPARAVMSFMCAKWAVSLLVVALHHRRKLINGQFAYQTLPTPDDESGGEGEA